MASQIDNYGMLFLQVSAAYKHLEQFNNSVISLGCVTLRSKKIHHLWYSSLNSKRFCAVCTVYSEQMIDIWENPTKSSIVNLPDLTASLESMMAAEVRSYLTKMDLTPWLGGALAALHSSLMEDVWPASMAAFSCFSESTLAPDTRCTYL